EDINEYTLYNDRDYYVSSWNNVAWLTNVMLAELTGDSQYHQRLSILLGAWVYGGSVSSPDYVIPPMQTSSKYNPSNPKLQNFTDPQTGVTYLVIPDCYPKAPYEEDCFDGIDDDCNGYIDRFDVACGLFPVLYTPKNLAFSSAPSLPNSATTAFISLIYSDQLSTQQSTQLECWSLGQATYMLGGNQGVNSFVVGYGDDAPTIVQQMASSCPPAGPSSNQSNQSLDILCSWDSGFFPSIANPRLDLVKGALVWGPSKWTDAFPDTSRLSDDTRVRLEDNVGFTGLLAGLESKRVDINTCFLGHGVWQKFVQTSGDI
ncbi:hypothetical protein CEUSTIGMA_g12764.t1, partial [Chlamydomonas eustigma]